MSKMREVWSSIPTKKKSGGGGVMEIQRALKEQGYDPGPLDGAMGPKTMKAIKEFQAANGLKPDGVAGPKTQEVLGGSAARGSADSSPAPPQSPKERARQDAKEVADHGKKDANEVLDHGKEAAEKLEDHARDAAKKLEDHAEKAAEGFIDRKEKAAEKWIDEQLGS